MFLVRGGGDVSEGLDEFAKCLTEKGFVMYGTYWCSHCQNEKRAFGKAFKEVNYVECTDNPKLCEEKQITGTPTWISGAGDRYLGEQGLERLSDASGCPLDI